MLIYTHLDYNESHFGRLAEITKNTDAHPLRIAHCIRDIAYGDKSRVDDLSAMVQSDDQKYQAIFKKCLRLPTSEEAKRETEKVARKKNRNRGPKNGTKLGTD